MAGETDLKKLLATMAPELRPGIHVFAKLPPDAPMPDSLEPVMLFREREGTTVIALEAKAKAAGLETVFRCRMVTLNIHSSLEAVGFLAAITTRLAAAEIGVNPVSAFYQDHLFVPVDRAEEAIDVLRRLAEENRGVTTFPP
ncbi:MULTISPECIES: ACT domain-containing protein [unclassified Mesorhizobium]|uniref:ACT domain-containing protein n=1 Tax=unclassified Mesorhizobium TaxID=325217 RepID=UPI000FD53D0E|nr:MULTISPECIES: ACT domain-containing protein [unclassified Mesorhizobium]RVB73958.1 ACT domain-containing protein [Mesorhizobium sp. M6A.T.Cr.TU.014.01.1.1]RWP70667.1 MAG: ACT domain-containing protein [Mesorhizobium sp.]RWP95957.1 MAG: ACT domain-containing protein [Mesorhizobium sp.]RWP96619.1 MAG: ACT domain-containing protein [Mesorhizobium sp.]